ncbi:MAG: hypothetical protein KGJ30_13115 [Burkholderiales bacterium]|nr:hypothetical protein [Burkholderiales bacterium]MDE1925783.1 hypothetical protein [Burkholderiales bacterium]MDE2159850.1 hypothetical protein [Burkholderiales bacterium]
MKSVTPLTNPARRRIVWALVAPGLVRAAAMDEARTLAVGPGRRWTALRDAVQEARSGDRIELDPGVYRRDVAVIDQARLTIVGLGAGARLIADGRNAEGKAILVVRGTQVAVENIEFRGARVPDGNGAGIRFEGARLTLHRCRFYDNEMGLITSNNEGPALSIDNCDFGAAPRHEGLLHHLLYVGRISSLELSRSRFSGGWRGHLVKSRARRNWVKHNRIDDGMTGEASYELEFPNGGDNRVVGNVIGQSPLTRNDTMLAMGAEARDEDSGRMLLESNVFINRAGPDGRFVHVWTEKLKGNTPMRAIGNTWAGPGTVGLPESADGGGNRRIKLADLPVG